MREFVLFTDSSCDLPADLADQLGLAVVPLSVTVGEDTYKNYLDGREITAKAFYDAIRDGADVHTSAVNTQAFLDALRPVLEEGKDILYLGFSSGLSGTYSAGAAAVRELADAYPARKIYAVDTLCASMGQGLLLYLAAQKKAAGAEAKAAYAKLLPDHPELKKEDLPLVYGRESDAPEKGRARVRHSGYRGHGAEYQAGHAHGYAGKARGRGQGARAARIHPGAV